jgi:hypothetical protein
VRPRVWLLVAFLALCAGFLTRGASQGPILDPGAPAPRRAPVRVPRSQTSGGDDRVAGPSPTASPGRNLFRYADQVAAPALPVVPRVVKPAPAPRSAPTPAAVRLVGFVRSGGRLRAVLALGGEVVVAGVGDRANGYGILAVDEDSGVRLSDPTGAELTVTPSDGR